jgi:hypothetical protein
MDLPVRSVPVASLRALLESAIDYAGMFPPARLPLSESLANYVRYRQSAEGWMLGRFVCPAEALDELCGLPQWRSLPSFLLSVTSTGRGSPGEMVQRLQADYRRIVAFREHGQSAGGTATPGTINWEIALRPEAPGESAVARVADAIVSLVAPQGTLNTVSFVYLESPLDNPAVSQFVQGVFLELRARKGKEPRSSAVGPLGNWLGLKFRTGGEQAMVPSSVVLGAAITLCFRDDVAWKATAGLHQPLTHRNPRTGQREFGFLNVLVAGSLGYDHGLLGEEIAKILAVHSLRQFRFEEDSLTWRRRVSNVARLKQGRSASCRAFGSCSFDEPVAGLRSLGLL